MTPDTPLRLAMWSGPRNISTAMMRAFGNRSDAAVIDEPLYAHYLDATGFDHPGAAEIIAAGPTDWRVAVEGLLGPVPGARPVFYQKHMSQHLLPGMDRAWIEGLTNCFLIRDPREVITSFVKVIESPRATDIGFPQQAELFESERRRTGEIPPVIDAKDVLTDPRRVLGALCDAVGIAFDRAMLSWPPGPRETDGVWAPHWYTNVEASTGFGPYKAKDEHVRPDLLGVYEECLDCYERLAPHRLGC